MVRRRFPSIVAAASRPRCPTDDRHVMLPRCARSFPHPEPSHIPSPRTRLRAYSSSIGPASRLGSRSSLATSFPAWKGEAGVDSPDTNHSPPMRIHPSLCTTKITFSASISSTYHFCNRALSTHASQRKVEPQAVCIARVSRFHKHLPFQPSPSPEHSPADV